MRNASGQQRQNERQKKEKKKKRKREQELKQQFFVCVSTYDAFPS